MSITYEEAVSGVIAKAYGAVAEGTYRNIFTGSREDLTAGKTEEQWVKEIEQKLAAVHQEELKGGMFNIPQKEMAGDAYHKLLDWLEKEKGIPLVKDDKGVAIRLSGFETNK